MNINDELTDEASWNMLAGHLQVNDPFVLMHFMPGEQMSFSHSSMSLQVLCGFLKKESFFVVEI